jgi:hypothetical protein
MTTTPTTSAQSEKSRKVGYTILLLLFLLPFTWWNAWCVATAWGWYAPQFRVAPGDLASGCGVDVDLPHDRTIEKRRRHPG